VQTHIRHLPDSHRSGLGASSAPRSNEDFEMNLRRFVLPSFAAAAAACLVPAWAADAPANTHMIDPDAIKWGDAPPSVPKGAKIAVLQGDPGKPGAYTMRLKLPANYKIAPHTHTQSENLTVMSGALYLGYGEKVDMPKAHALKAGGYHFLPGKTPHYAFTKTATTVQVSGEGPFDINYIDPKDNPEKAAAKP